MALSLADLRASRKSDFSNIAAALSKKAEGGNFAKDDDGFFKVTRDKAGNGSATIRFLPKHQDDELPWVQLYSHAFQSAGGKWFIDNCPTTLGGDCPVCQANREVYKSGTEEDKKKIAGPRKRKLNYIANILVVKDSAHPENEGKVFKFKFGKKIFEMIMDKVQPTFEDEVAVNIFDPWEGADFKLRMHMADNYPSYAKSTWADPAAIADDDEQILEVLNKAEPLGKLIEPSKFKPYDDLKTRFDNFNNAAPTSVGAAEDVVRQMREEVAAATPAPKVKAPAPVESKKVAAPTSSEDEDLEKYFQGLAE